ncbi:hypothetical protein [Streptomyces cacaoi]|uniref:hypothetical protein n=1 Tax=Streptomyces cacaoi TaxID=1898 RepID=UPI003749E82F
MDEQQLGWMATDRARQLAGAAQDVLAVAESARRLAALARKAGWHSEALSIALSAPTTRICAAPDGPGPRYAAFSCRAPDTPSHAGATGTGCGS